MSKEDLGKDFGRRVLERTRTIFAILDDEHKVIPIDYDHLSLWNKWFEQTSNRRVAQDRINQYFVSTVFLAINHGFLADYNEWFETMVFDENPGGELGKDKLHRRYATWDEAIKGHKEIVEIVRYGNL
jgi:hypothetical protein